MDSTTMGVARTFKKWGINIKTRRSVEHCTPHADVILSIKASLNFQIKKQCVEFSFFNLLLTLSTHA